MSEYPKGSTARPYHDMDGNIITLHRLVRQGPDWAVSRIRHCEDYEQLQQQNAELMAQVEMLKQSMLHISEYWNGDTNHLAMSDALEHIENEARIRAGETPPQSLAAHDAEVVDRLKAWAIENSKTDWSGTSGNEFIYIKDINEFSQQLRDKEKEQDG